MKRTFGILTAALLMAALVIAAPKAALADAEGDCGENVTYYYDSTEKVLTLTGEGATNDYTNSGSNRSPFYQNTAIRNNCTRIVVGEGITSIGSYLFFYLNQVETVELPSTLTEVHNFGFGSCFKINSMELPSGLTVIGESAFTGCRALPSVTIPAGVTELPKQCFNNCWALTSVTIPGTVVSVGQSAFGGCTALAQVVIEEGVETIGMTAFSSTAAASVDIPASVTSLSPDAFSGAANFTAFNVNADNPNYSDVDGVLYDKEHTTLLKCPGAFAGTHEIVSGCTAIADNAFENCFQLTGVTIPTTVTSIGSNGFMNAGITEITIPESVTELGSGVLQGCQNLVTATVNANVPALTQYMINGCPALETVVLGPSIQAYGVGAFSYDAALTSVTVPEGLTEIPDSCFQGCSSLASFEFPATVTTIGMSAFADCTSLANVTLPESLTVISTGAFNHCILFTEITIPAGVTRIEGQLFNRCFGLTEVRILGEIVYVGGNAFGNCTELTAVYFNCPPLSQQDTGWGVFNGSPEVRIHYPNAFPDWPVVKPFDKNGYVGVYVEDDVAAKVEHIVTELRARSEEDNKKDLRFLFRLTPKDGVTVARRFVSLSVPDAGVELMLRSYKNFQGDLDGTIIFTAVLGNIDESMFSYPVTAQAFLVMRGDWEGRGYSLPVTVCVNDLLNAD